MSGMDELGKAIADGRISLAKALDELMSAHVRLFGLPGTPGGMYRLEERTLHRLVEITEKFTDKTVREWWPPRVLPELKNHGQQHENSIDTGR